MRGFELVKREDHWALYNEDGHKIAATLPGCNSKLSIKNCEAIANGYDLDELSHKEYLLHENNDELYGDSLELRLAYKAGVYDGLKRMLTVLGDKKFSEEDILDAWEDGATQQHPLTKSKKENLLKSLQQTKWKVEIVTKPYTEVSEGFNLESKREPKLDANGYLILKRI